MGKMSEELKAFFKEDELDWRVQQSGTTPKGVWAMVLCYIQARAIQKRLDEVVGMWNWKDEYRVEGNNIICRLSIREQGGEWISKENGASQTDIEAFKGGISGAFKRVASSGFGIGRYLYELPTVFANCTTEKPKDRTTWHSGKANGKKFYWQNPAMRQEFLLEEEQQKEKPTQKDMLKPVVRELNNEARLEIEKKNAEKCDNIFVSIMEEAKNVKSDADFEVFWKTKKRELNFLQKHNEANYNSLVGELKKMREKL